jgi:excisionase family DNA binding protein
MDAPPPDPMSVAEAAEALGVSERTVWRYLRSGRLDGTTVGPPGERRTLIPAAAVAALAGERVDGPEAAALRAERDRLAEQLAAAEAARAALEARLAVLQRAIARVPAREGLVTRALGRAAAARRARPTRPGRPEPARAGIN